MPFFRGWPAEFGHSVSLDRRWHGFARRKRLVFDCFFPTVAIQQLLWRDKPETAQDQQKIRLILRAAAKRCEEG
jgi:hypothetical protein